MGISEKAAWLRAWRTRMGYSVPQAAVALGLSLSRMQDNLYISTRPPSPRTLRLAEMIERDHNPER